MMSGGPVMEYFKSWADDKKNMIIFVGYQAEGTRGRQLQDGANEIRFFGKNYSVKASIRSIESLSAHADQNDLINWMGNIKNIPEKVYLIHGESAALDAFRVKIKATYRWNVTIPKLTDIEEVLI